jgi:hypothetical protein
LTNHPGWLFYFAGRNAAAINEQKALTVYRSHGIPTDTASAHRALGMNRCTRRSNSRLILRAQIVGLETLESVIRNRGVAGTRHRGAILNPNTGPRRKSATILGQQHQNRRRAYLDCATKHGSGVRSVSRASKTQQQPPTVKGSSSSRTIPRWGQHDRTIKVFSR